VFADLSIWHILILIAIITLLFGSKRIPEMGRSIGKGIQEFKAGLREATSPEEPTTPPTAQKSDPHSLPTSGAPKRLSE
jgi:sec-independent protein translocase protein TatA